MLLYVLNNTSAVRTSCSSSVSPQKPAMKSLESPSPMPPGLLPPIIALAFATNPSYACKEEEEGGDLRREEREGEKRKGGAGDEEMRRLGGGENNRVAGRKRGWDGS